MGDSAKKGLLAQAWAFGKLRELKTEKPEVLKLDGDKQEINEDEEVEDENGVDTSEEE